jgi:hypothetical protein
MSPTQEKIFDIQAMLDVLNRDLISALEISRIDPAIESLMKNFLANDLQSIRFNMLVDQMAIGDTWAMIRKEEVVSDLVMDLTTTLHFHASSLYRNGWDELVRLMTEAIAVFNNTKTQPVHCALDDQDERDRYITPTQAKSFLESNPWLVVLYLMRQTDIVRVLCAELANLARTRQTRPSNDRTDGT